MPVRRNEITEPRVAAPATALAIRLEHVRKAYKIYDKSFSFLREVLTGRPCHREKPVLENISLDIRRGEVVGIIGRNGAGKSTLLKLIAGTLAPTDGKITVDGRVSAILELGTGFNPAYSGRDNVIMSALMRGMSEAEVRRKFDAIVAFSGLEDVIDQPFQTYSSGMQARLAFAAAVSVEADVIIIDEALAAGDIRFAARSLRRIREICESGVTALFVSHTTYQVMQLCTRAIWIDNGRIRMDGEPIGVVRAYEYEMQEQIAQDQGRRSPTPAPVPDNRDEKYSVELPMALPVAEGSAVGTRLTEAPSSGTEPRTNGRNASRRKAVPKVALEMDSVLAEDDWEESPPGPRATAGDGAGERSPATETYRVLDITFLDRAGQSKRAFRFGDQLRMRVVYQYVVSQPPPPPCRLAITFYRAGDFEPVMYFNSNDLPSGRDVHKVPDTAFRPSGRGVFDAVVDPIQLRADDYYVSVAIASDPPRTGKRYELPQSQTRLTILPNGFDEPCVFYPIVTWRNGPATEGG
jgi:ABC-type polysaccharide/polyol phosphate transport system ATPase subunit